MCGGNIHSVIIALLYIKDNVSKFANDPKQ